GGDRITAWCVLRGRVWDMSENAACEGLFDPEFLRTFRFNAHENPLARINVAPSTKGGGRKGQPGAAAAAQPRGKRRAVLFCSSKRCLVHSHEWAKAVDQGLNEQIFFVKVNTDSNPQLSHRFAPLEKTGTLILLREGQAPLKAEELVSWASRGYLSSPALPVPEPVSAYDLFLNSLAEHKWTVMLTGGVLAALSVLFALPGGRNAKAAAAKKKSPKSQ
ncbi:hypothetical protein H632_c1441p0, partial [Helicosporidium sp. ATCC 50920]